MSESVRQCGVRVMGEGGSEIECSGRESRVDNFFIYED